MKLRVKYTAQLRSVLGRSEEDVELSEGCSLASLLNDLSARLGDGASGHLVAADGRMHRSLLIVVNDRAVTPQDAAGTLLRSGDVVTLLPPIAGG